MKKRLCCVFLTVCLVLSLPLFAQAIPITGGPIHEGNLTDPAAPTLSISSIPTGAIAVAKNLMTGSQYYYQVSGGTLSADQPLSEPGWMPDSMTAVGGIASGGIAAPDVIVGPDDRTFVSDTTGQPYSAIMILAALYPNNVEKYGSAALIGPNAAVTCAHTLYHPDLGGWPTAVIAILHWYNNSGTDVYKMSYVSEIAISVPFYELEANSPSIAEDHDWAVIRLVTSLGNYGYLGFKYQIPGSALIAGYPGDLNGHDGTSQGSMQTLYQFQGSGNISEVTTGTTICSNGTSYDYRRIKHYIDYTDGQSGGPLMDNNNSYQIFGIVSGGFGSTMNRDCGITSSMFSFFWAYKNNS